jgi:hypothetical protein
VQSYKCAYLGLVVSLRSWLTVFGATALSADIPALLKDKLLLPCGFCANSKSSTHPGPDLSLITLGVSSPTSWAYLSSISANDILARSFLNYLKSGRCANHTLASTTSRPSRHSAGRLLRAKFGLLESIARSI